MVPNIHVDLVTRMNIIRLKFLLIKVTSMPVHVYTNMHMYTQITVIKL